MTGPDTAAARRMADRLNLRANLHDTIFAPSELEEIALEIRELADALDAVKGALRRRVLGDTNRATLDPTHTERGST